MDVTTRTVDETHTVAAQIVSDLSSNVLALTGDLGSGKTVFTQGIGKALGVERLITSPTFLLLKTYNTSVEKYSKLVHVDLYRVSGWDEVCELALQEVWANSKNLLVIEWAERIKDYLPTHTQWVEFEYLGEDERRIVTRALNTGTGRL